MICRLTGRIAEVTQHTAVVELNGLAYEVLVPASSVPDLQRLHGNEATFFTIQYLDGNPNLGNLVPRLIGFLCEPDRDFFNLFVKVKNIGMRKALRAMQVPAHTIADAIERGDEQFLTSLPEIGKRTAAQIVVQLRGKLEGFRVPSAAPTPTAEMTHAQKVALEILVQWGDRRADAQRWIAQTVELRPELTDAEAIVRAVYRTKAGVQPAGG